MVVSLSVVSHLGGFSMLYSNLDETQRKEVLEEACLIAEKKLADMKFLKEFTWDGQQAFYNDKSDDTWSFRSPSPDYHLSDNFMIWLNAGATNFEISNSKMVGSSKGRYNLFDLLWYGFGPWAANRTVHTPSAEVMSWHMRTKKLQRKLKAMGGPMVEADARISFHYRYAGKWFYKLTERKGMESGLVDKFHLYIDTALTRSIEEAIENNNSEDVNSLMRDT